MKSKHRPVAGRSAGEPRQLPIGRILIVSAAWVIVFLSTFVQGSVDRIGFAGYLLVTLLASLLIDYRAGLLISGISVMAAGVAFVAIARGYSLLPAYALPANTVFHWGIQAVVFIVISFVAHIILRSYQRALARAVAHEAHLERRAVQLQVAADIARDATAVREVDTLLRRAVHLICDRFGYYHAGIFLIDRHKQVAVLAAAAGLASQQLLAQRHRLKVGQEGIVGFVAFTGKPRIAPDVGEDAAHLKNPLLEQTRSEMAVPLVVNRQVVGVLDVQSRQAAAFDEEDIAILQTLADQLAMIYETAGLFEARQRQLDELTLLHSVAVASTESSSEDTLIETATRVIGQTLSPDNYGVLLLDEKSGLLHAHYSYHERLNTTQAPIPVGAGITGMVALEGKSRLTGDVRKVPAYIAIDVEIVSEVCVPLKAGEQILGVVNAESTQPNAFSKSDERLLATLAGQLATALEKIRLLEDQQRQVQEMASLLELSGAVSVSLNKEDFLAASVERIARALNADGCAVLEWDRKNDALIVMYDYLLVSGVASDSPGTRYPLANSPGARSLLENRLPLNVRSGDQRADSYERQWLVDQNYRSLLMVPLVARGEVTGALRLIAAQDERSFRSHEISLCQTMANQLAVGLENSRLYTEAQRRAKELAAALARLKELDRLKSEFIQNVSHELRTPLAIVRGYAEMLDQGDLGQLDEEQSESIGVIVRRVRMLSKMVDDLTAILEAEANNQRRELVDLPSLLQTQMADFQDTFKRYGLVADASIQPGLPMLVGNPDQMNRVIDNLISNAIKFTPEGGQIAVRLWQEAEKLILEVSDSGIGIPQDHLEHIFERFYQVDGSTTRRYGGTGLGLALVKEIVEAHGGQVAVKSQPGAGSTFTAYLPLSPAIIHEGNPGFSPIVSDT